MSNDLQPTPGAPADYPFAELHVRAVLGLNKDEMRALRQERLESQDFARHKKRLYLSPGAVKKLAAGAPGVSLQKSASASPSSNPLDCDPAPLELRVCRPDTANPRIALVCPPGQDFLHPKTVYRLRIQEGTMLRLGELVIAKPIRPYTDYFAFVRRPSRQRPH